MTAEEKTLILGALFHDIGKFEQRCTGNPNKKYHTELGKEFVNSGQFQDRFEKIVGKENIALLSEIISEHHNNNARGLTAIVREADRLSASERVNKELAVVFQDQWRHKHLASLFSKVELLSKIKKDIRYYKHITLTKDDYDVIIPKELSDEEIKSGELSYSPNVFNNFNNDLEAVLDFYNDDSDFESLINLILIIFEKYMWCIPDFTGSPETDISLYNHLKDVAGFAHAIYLTKKHNTESTNLNLIIGDIPGIQNYIFNVVNRKPAKILRGRSIFVQILTRNFATLFIKKLNLTEANLIMLAGGKFYIAAPDTKNFEEKFKEANGEIEKYLYEEFRIQLRFNSAYQIFDYEDLKKNIKSFGQIVEEASHKLLENRYRLFEGRFFNNNSPGNFVLKENYINDDGTGTDSVKCRVTDIPIREGRKDNKTIPTDDGFLSVDVQVAAEYLIGHNVVANNTVVPIKNSLYVEVSGISHIDEYKGKNDNSIKILINPDIKDLKEKINRKKDVFRDTYYLEVANYCSRDNVGDIMDFKEIADNNKGAEFLTLIKGDIDNLGLIMAYGLTRFKSNEENENEKDFTAISRTTTLSNHLKYFFSFFLNGFLKDWELKLQKYIVDKAKIENPGLTEEEIIQLKNENRVYTIFAGGDDLMLVTPQSSAIKLINALNSKFQEFACSNQEVHISYSLTHFKDHTPVRLVSEFAEENQKEGKEYTRDFQNIFLQKEKRKAFLSENDKSGTFLFQTFVKNNDLKYLINQIEYLTKKAEEEKSGLSRGLLRRLYELSEMIKKYEQTDDAAYLITYSRLNYSVNRLLKDKSEEIKTFFENVLLINNENNEESKRIKKILHPLVCQVIYNIRKK